MKLKRDNSKNARHNERKALILFLLVKARESRKYLYISDIAKKIGITNNNAARQMTKLYGQGYIHRRKQLFDHRNGHNGEYEYCFLQPMGLRVAKELWIRMKLREIDSRVSLKLKKLIPPDLFMMHEKIGFEYKKWMQEKEQW